MSLASRLLLSGLLTIASATAGVAQAPPIDARLPAWLAAHPAPAEPSVALPGPWADRLSSYHASASGAVLTVTTTADAGAGSLREAIEAANATPEPDTIAFSIGGGGDYQEIFLESPLPFATAPVLIDGDSQGCDTSEGPCIRLDGGAIPYPGAAANPAGLVLLGGSSRVHGLHLTRFFRDELDPAIWLASADNAVTACRIGTDRSGSTTDPDGTPDSGDELGNGFGISVGRSDTGGADVTGNVVGGADAADRNVIAGSTYSGVYVGHSVGTAVVGNYIGTDATGTASIANSQTGVLVGVGAVGTAITANVLSGNGETGVGIQSGATGVVVRDNLIGTDATGAVTVPNGTLAGLAQLNGIGVEVRFAEGTVVERNVISGNLLAGVVLGAAGVADGEGPPVVAGSRVVSNLIGFDGGGTAPLPNGVPGIPDVGFGVVLFAAPGVMVTGNQIGGAGAGAANVIGHNTSAGIGAEGPGVVGNVIDGNLIGVDADAEPAPNGQVGILFRNGPSGNQIGALDLDGESTEFPGNYIAFQPLGVALGDFTGGNDVTYNTFGGQPGAYLPVDLGANGPTANDAGDFDEGPNRVQNTPEILATPVDGNRVTVHYRVDTAADNASYPLTVRFYGQEIEGGVLYHVPFGSATYAGPGEATATFDNPFDGPAVIVATATDADGNTGEVTQSGVAVAEAMAPDASEGVRVGPNPTAGPVQLSFVLATPAEVSVALFDVLGREVAATGGVRLGAGAHVLPFERALPAGIYVWRLRAGPRIETGRVTVAR